MIPARQVLPLKQVAEQQLLGNDVEPYITCLQQIALAISCLHSRNVILCDFTALDIMAEVGGSGYPNPRVKRA
jgi:hypothetical protein